MNVDIVRRRGRHTPFKLRERVGEASTAAYGHVRNGVREIQHETENAFEDSAAAKTSGGTPAAASIGGSRQQRFPRPCLHLLRGRNDCGGHEAPVGRNNCGGHKRHCCLHSLVQGAPPPLPAMGWEWTPPPQRQIRQRNGRWRAGASVYWAGSGERLGAAGDLGSGRAPRGARERRSRGGQGSGKALWRILGTDPGEDGGEGDARFWARRR